MFDPQRAVLVESGDPVFRWHEFRAALFRCGPYEFEDRLLAGPSFHEPNGLSCVAWLWASAESGIPDKAGNNARLEIRTRRLMLNGEWSDFIFELLLFELSREAPTSDGSNFEGV